MLSVIGQPSSVVITVNKSERDEDNYILTVVNNRNMLSKSSRRTAGRGAMWIGHAEV